MPSALPLPIRNLRQRLLESRASSVVLNAGNSRTRNFRAPSAAEQRTLGKMHPAARRKGSHKDMGRWFRSTHSLRINRRVAMIAKLRVGLDGGYCAQGVPDNRQKKKALITLNNCG